MILAHLQKHPPEPRLVPTSTKPRVPAQGQTSCRPNRLMQNQAYTGQDEALEAIWPMAFTQAKGMGIYDWGKAPSELVLSDQGKRQHAKLKNDLPGQSVVFAVHPEKAWKS